MIKAFSENKVTLTDYLMTSLGVDIHIVWCVLLCTLRLPGVVFSLTWYHIVIGLSLSVSVAQRLCNDHCDMLRDYG